MEGKQHNAMTDKGSQQELNTRTGSIRSHIRMQNGNVHKCIDTSDVIKAG